MNHSLIRKHLLRCCVLSACIFASLILPPAGQAAEAEQEPKPQADERDAPDAQKQVEKSEAQTKRGDIFLPSEEISEDFAVSFPTDI